jgi:hypothetical protein
MVDYFESERYQQDFYRDQASAWRDDINKRLLSLDLPDGVKSVTPFGSYTPFLPFGYDFRDQGSISSYLNNQIERDILNLTSAFNDIESDNFYKAKPDQNSTSTAISSQENIKESSALEILRSSIALLKKLTKKRYK